MKSVIVSIFLVFFITTSACAWHLVSDPSPENATHWKIVLDNGSEYNGTTENGMLYWDTTDLPTGNYSGDAYFGKRMWNVTGPNSTDTAGWVWSDPARFTLERHSAPGKPSEIIIKEDK